MLGRPTFDEVVLVALALVVLLGVQLAARGDDSDTERGSVTATPEATTVASIPATSPTATPTPESVATSTPTPDPTATPADEADSPDECNFRDEFERVRGAVVRIRSPIGPLHAAVGTGFHIGDGRYVTAAHVVSDEAGNTYTEIWVESAVSGRTELAQIAQLGSFNPEGTTQERDLAVLRAPPIEHSIPYRVPSADDIDLDVRALGYPWSQARDESADIPPPVVVRGVLANTAVRDGIAVVQADVQAQSGMSGGPLVDACGDAIAVASAQPQARAGQTGEGLTVFISMAELEKLR